MKITAQQFLSNNHSKGKFVTIFRHLSENSTKTTEEEGDLYCLLSISGGESLPAERVSKFVWDGILDGYIYSSNKSTNESLKDAITEGVKQLKNLIKNDKTLEELGVNVNFVLLAKKKEGLYIGNLGDNEIYVFKEGKFVDITEILGKSKASTAGIALKEGDILIATNGSILKEKIELLENSQDILKSLNKIGNELKEYGGMLYFAYGEGKVENVESLPNIKTIIMPKPVEDKKTINISSIHIPKPKFNFKKINLGKIGEYVEDVKKGLGWLIRKISPIIKVLGEKIKVGQSKIAKALSDKFGKKRWFKKVASRVSQVKINVPQYSPKGMRIDGYRVKNLQNKRVKLVFIIVIGITLLALGINFTIKTKQANEVHSQATKIFTSVETLTKKAENMSTSDKSSTETAIYQAQNTLKELPENMSSKDIATRDGYNIRLLAVEDFLYKRVGVTDNDGKLTTFLDTHLAFGENSNPTDIEIYTDNSSNEYLVVTDSGTKAVYRVALYDKALTKITDTDSLVKDPLYVSMGNTGIFVYDDKTGVIKAPFNTDNSIGTFVALSGLGRSNIQSKNIGEFIVLTSSDNVYLLAKDESALLKSAFSYGNSYGLNYKYVTDTKLANANDVLADLSLYFTTSDSPNLLRYTYDYVAQTQVESDLSLTGLNGDLTGVTKGFTRESLDYSLFLYDATNKRFLKFEKPQETENLHPGEAVLKEQVVYRGTKTSMWSNVKDFVVDSNGTSMYILDGTSIYKVVL